MALIFLILIPHPDIHLGFPSFWLSFAPVFGLLGLLTPPPQWVIGRHEIVQVTHREKALGEGVSAAHHVTV